MPTAMLPPRQKEERIVPWLRRGLLTVLVLGTASCVSTMRDYEGHTVFNPLFLFYLESSKRDRWQKPDEVLQALRLRTGDIVADVGAGGGYFTEKLARRVAPAGHVYATDVQDVMIKKLRKRVETQSLTNVTVIRAGFDDPKLPSASCDLALFSSVYKEIQGREEYMKKIRLALKPTGRVAILEYRPEEPSPGPPKRYRLPENRVVAEMETAGFTLLDRFDFLPREYFLLFAVSPPQESIRDASPR